MGLMLLLYQSRCIDSYVTALYATWPLVTKRYLDQAVHLSVVDVARENLHYSKKYTTEDIYVVKHLNTALLSRPASVSLRLVARVDSIDMASVKQN